jgi:N-acetylneuraminic acid mutarotase
MDAMFPHIAPSIRLRRSGFWSGVAVLGLMFWGAALSDAKQFTDQLSTDFQAGVDDNIQINQNIQSGLQLAPYAMLGSWNDANGPVNALYLAAACVYNGKVYVSGGRGQADSSGSSGAQDTILNTIHFGNILPDGSIEKWDPEKLVPLPQPTYGHGSVVMNGRLYILGGRTAQATTSTLDAVYWGKIFGHDGQIKAQYQPNTWTAVASLPRALFRPAVFHYEGRIYVIGGQDSTGAAQSRIYFALVQPSGDIPAGSWQQNAVDLAMPLSGHSALVSNGRVYVIGGSSTGEVKDVQSQVYVGSIDPVSGQILGIQTPTTPLPDPSFDGAAALTGGKLWVCGGATSGTANAKNTVYYAGIDPATGLIPTTGTPGQDTWTRGTDLPAPVMWHSMVAYNNHLIVIGGTNNVGPQKQVFTSTLIKNNQNVTSWIPTTPLFLSQYGGGIRDIWTGHSAVVKLPVATQGSSSQAPQTSVFVLGGGPNTFNAFGTGMGDPGQDPPQAYSSVYQANVDNSGNLQTWVADPSKGQLPVASILHSSTIAMSNQIYVIGGVNSTNAAIWAGAASRSTVAFYQPNTWTAWVQPPWWYIGQPQVFFEATSSGSSGLGNFEGTAGIPLLDPTGTALMPIYQPLIRAAAVSYNDTLYVLGGISRENSDAPNTPGPPADPTNPGGSYPICQNRIWFCKPNPGGSINSVGNPGGWKETVPLPQPLYDLAACVANNRLYVFGGRDATGTPVPFVVFYTFNPDGTLNGPFNTNRMFQDPNDASPYSVGEHAVVFASGHFYVLGGSADAAGGTLQNAVLYCTPDPGTGAIPAAGNPGTWDLTTTLLAQRVAGHQAVAANGFIYLLGGRYDLPHASSAYLINITDVAYRDYQTFAGIGNFERYIDLDRDQYLDELEWLGTPNSQTTLMKARYALEKGVWSDWTPSSAFSPIPVRRVARYIHYKLTLQSNANIPPNAQTPLVTQVSLDYAASKAVGQDSLMVNRNQFDPQVEPLVISYQTRDQDVANVILRVYNLEGEMIRRFDIDIPGGTPLPTTGVWNWDGTNENGELVANGVYLIQFNSGDTHKLRKVVLFKH